MIIFKKTKVNSNFLHQPPVILHETLEIAIKLKTLPTTKASQIEMPLL